MNLTEKEAQILPYIVKGKENKEIAQTMCITNETVKAHVGSIMRKFKVKNRTEIAYHVFINSIIDIDELKKKFDRK